MSEEIPQLSEREKRRLEEEEKERQLVRTKYRDRGFQKMTLADYEALRNKKSRFRFFQLPLYMQFILGTPLLIIFCAGLYFLPYILFLIASSPAVEAGPHAPSHLSFTAEPTSP